jgi:hypothetical protein
MMHGKSNIKFFTVVITHTVTGIHTDLTDWKLRGKVNLQRTKRPYYYSP